MPRGYDETNEKVQVDDFSCAIKEGEIIRLVNYPNVLKVISGSMKLDKAGY